MKKYLLAIILSLFAFTATAQSPSLAVGLETLTLNKGQIDVAALTEIIMEKQRELKQEALKRFMFKLFPQTNYTSKYYVQNCLHILLNEKNPQVIEKEILELTTNYALAMGVASVVVQNENYICDLKPIYQAYEARIIRYSAPDKDKIEQERLKKDVDSMMDVVKKDYSDYNKDKLEDNINKLRRYEMRHKMIPATPRIQNAEYFGLALDISAAALSDIDELRSKGFFKKRIDYINDPYFHELDPIVRKSMRDLQINIRKRVTPYIRSYEIIKEFHSKFKYGIEEGEIEISSRLTGEYANIIIAEVGGAKIQELLMNSKSITTNLINTLKKFSVYDDELKDVAQIKQSLRTLQTASSSSIDKELKENEKKQGEIWDELKEYNEKYSTISHLNVMQNPKPYLYGNQNKNKAKEAQEDKTMYDRFKADLDTIEKSMTKQNIGLDNAKRLITNLTNTQGQIIEARENKYRNDTLFDAQIVLLKNFKLDLLTSTTKTKLQSWLNNEDKRDSIELLTAIIDSIPRSDTAILAKIKTEFNTLLKDKDVLTVFFSELLNKFSNSDSFALNIDRSKEYEYEENARYTNGLAKIYVTLKTISKADSISLGEINYIDEHVIPFFINYGMLNPQSKNLSNRIDEFRLLSNLLKIRAVSNVGLQKYDNSYMKVFGLIANLGNLDKANTYQQMLDLFQDGNRYVEDNLINTKFGDTYSLFSNSIRKYTLINTDKQYVNIDVASFLSEMQQYYDRRNTSRLGLYLTLGLNQAYFFQGTEIDGKWKYSGTQIGFASEKLGLRVRLVRFGRLKDYENAVHNDVNLNRNAPFFNDLHFAFFGSGLLYSVANTVTDTNFDYVQAGFALGLRFYNALDLNFTYSVPFIDGKNFLRRGIFGLGLDIPLGQYLERIGRK